jgi:hypothetical protein
LTPRRKAGMLMDITPDMNWATERKTEVRFTAKPVWEKRVLNCVSLTNYPFIGIEKM